MRETSVTKVERSGQNDDRLLSTATQVCDESECRFGSFLSLGSRNSAGNIPGRSDTHKQNYLNYDSSNDNVFMNGPLFQLCDICDISTVLCSHCITATRSKAGISLSWNYTTGNYISLYKDCGSV